jgi:hypothetical protein
MHIRWAPLGALTALLVILLVTLTPPSLGCKPGLGSAVIADLTPIGSCVIGQLAAGVEDPLQIVGACVGATLAGLAAFLETLLTPVAGEAGLLGLPSAGPAVQPDPLYLHAMAAKIRVRALLLDAAP